MSLFLGKIHYWLFNKILWFENLEEEIAAWGEKQGLPIEAWRKEIYTRIGKPTDKKPLEEMIDTSNIHGWLQACITRAEGRHAAWITNILKVNTEYKQALLEIATSQGQRAGKLLKEEHAVQTPKEIFDSIYDYLLEGMPCDRVILILDQSENEISWKTTRCLHQEFWDAVDRDVQNFYDIREAWTKAFVSESSDNFTYEKVSESIHHIFRK